MPTCPVKALVMTENERVFYTARTHTTGSREKGVSRSSDGRLDVKLSAPGGPGMGTNPEQLFASGWSACFASALALVARAMKVTLPAGVAIDAEVDLKQGDDGYFLSARLDVALPGVEATLAAVLIEGAHRACPYSKATRGNVDVSVKVV